MPGDRLWGAQTQRSLEHFRISSEKIPPELIRAMLIIKRESARVNVELGILEPKIANAIVAAAEEALAGKHDGEFPLAVWQTGSGTQTNRVNRSPAARCYSRRISLAARSRMSAMRRCSSAEASMIDASAARSVRRA